MYKIEFLNWLLILDQISVLLSFQKLGLDRLHNGKIYNYYKLFTQKKSSTVLRTVTVRISTAFQTPHRLIKRLIREGLRPNLVNPNIKV